VGLHLPARRTWTDVLFLEKWSTCLNGLDAGASYEHNFLRFSLIFGEKIGVILRKHALIKVLKKTAVVWAKKATLSPNFSAKILHNIGPLFTVKICDIQELLHHSRYAKYALWNVNKDLYEGGTGELGINRPLSGKLLSTLLLLFSFQRYQKYWSREVITREWNFIPRCANSMSWAWQST
jgi:hypothetical protein